METKHFKTEKVKEGRIEAIVATLGTIDKDGDVTEAGAFGDQTVVMLPTHDWSSVPLGKGTISEDGEKAIAKLKMNDTELASEWYKALRFDYENQPSIQEWSYGFDILASRQGEFQGEKVRFLEQLRIHEVSPVLVGAGINTQTLNVKRQNQLPLHVQAEMDSIFQRASALHLKIEFEKTCERIRASDEQACIGQLHRDFLQTRDNYLTFHYRKMSPIYVSTEQRKLAGEVVKSVASQLGIEPPPLHWFRPEGYLEKQERLRTDSTLEGIRADEPIWGMARGGKEVWLKSDLTDWTLAKVVCHECLHIAHPELPEPEIVNLEPAYMEGVYK